MQHLLRTAIMIVAAMMGSAILLAGLILAVGSLTTYGSEPADFLSSENTVALLHYPTKEVMQSWSEVFPVLASVPFQTGSTIAIVENDETQHAIRFHIAKNNTIGAYATWVSSSVAEEMFGRPQYPIGKDPSYKELHSAQDRNAMWTYIHAHNLPKPSGLRQVVEHTLIYGNNAVGITEQEGQLIIQKPSLHNDYIGIKKEFANIQNAIARISLAKPEVLWRELLKNLPQQSQIVVQGIVQQYVATLGTDISLEYDILPLLQEPAVLHITQSDGVLGFLLEGSKRDRINRETILDRIHQSFASKTSASTVTRRVLDQRFSAIDIRHDPKRIVLEQEEFEGWIIHTTKNPRDPYPIVTATKEQSFLLSNAEEIIKEAIKSRVLDSNSLPTESIRSTGFIDMPSFTDWITSFLQSTDSTPLQDWGETLYWNTNTHGSLKKITVQKEPFF